MWLKVLSVTQSKPEKGVGVSGRQSEKKCCLLADAGRRCQPSSRATFPAQQSENEAVYPMKYSPKLPLLKKEREQRGQSVMERRSSPLERSSCQICLGPLSKDHDRDSSRGSIKSSHKCTPNSSAQRIPKKNPHSAAPSIISPADIVAFPRDYIDILYFPVHV